MKSYVPARSLSPSMRTLLLVLIALGATACGSSRPATSEGGFVLSERENGDIDIQLGDTSSETLLAALMAAADRTAWVPPPLVGSMRQLDTADLGAAGRVYRYGLEDGRFDVYVYRDAAGAEAQIENTRLALSELVAQGRIDAFEAAGPATTREVAWQDTTATLTRVEFLETIEARPFTSVMVLLKPSLHWIKVRVSYPQSAYARNDIDALVEALLTSE